MGTPWPVSGIHGTGMGELMDEIVKPLPPRATLAADDDDGGPLRIAILGKPNVGKSSLLNRLTGSDRAIVSKVHTT